MITLKQYTNEQNQILPLIQGFWKVHSNYAQSEAEAQEDLYNWTNRVMLSISSEMMKPMWALHIWEAAAGK